LTPSYPDATLDVMPKPDIHQLEERVLTLMGEFRRLKEENQRLSREVDQLIHEKETLANENNLNQGNQARLSQLEALNKKNKKDQKTIRTKVQTILNNLDKFDPA
jgi:FtsZ-binding cell division protein ZapB